MKDIKSIVLTIGPILVLTVSGHVFTWKIDGKEHRVHLNRIMEDEEFDFDYSHDGDDWRLTLEYEKIEGADTVFVRHQDINSDSDPCAVITIVF